MAKINQIIVDLPEEIELILYKDLLKEIDQSITNPIWINNAAEVLCLKKALNPTEDFEYVNTRDGMELMLGNIIVCIYEYNDWDFSNLRNFKEGREIRIKAKLHIINKPFNGMTLDIAKASANDGY